MTQISETFSHGLDLHLSWLLDEVQSNLKMFLKRPFWSLVGVYVCKYSNSKFIIRERECMGVVCRIFESLDSRDRNSFETSRKLLERFQELDSIFEGIMISISSMPGLNASSLYHFP
jgi:hypothetical protein